MARIEMLRVENERFKKALILIANARKEIKGISIGEQWCRSVAEKALLNVSEVENGQE